MRISYWSSDVCSSDLAHGHPQGEGILVLDGVFSDEHGDYPAGTFLLNPAGFRHAPFSEAGCLLLVKLCQFPGEGREHRAIDPTSAEGRAAAPGAELLGLYRDDRYPEDIVMLRLTAGSRLPPQMIDAAAAPHGLEIFVVSGGLVADGARYAAGAWLREPHGIAKHFTASADTTLYIKRNHLGG